MLNTLLLIILSIVIGSSTSFAQSDSLYILTTKSGSIIKGELVSKDVNYTKIKTIDDNIWAFSYQEIESLEAISDKFPEIHFQNQTSMALLSGNQNETPKNIVSIQMINGLTLPFQSFMGLGFGIEDFRQKYIPLFINFRKTFFKEYIKPSISFQGGYNFKTENAYDDGSEKFTMKGGPMASITTGLAFPVNDANMITFEIGYRFQKLTYDVTGLWGYDYNNRTRTEEFNRLEMRIGLTFR